MVYSLLGKSSQVPIPHSKSIKNGQLRQSLEPETIRKSAVRQKKQYFRELGVICIGVCSQSKLQPVVRSWVQGPCCRCMHQTHKERAIDKDKPPEIKFWNKHYLALYHFCQRHTPQRQISRNRLHLQRTKNTRSISWGSRALRAYP